jgi:carbonic anhydrase
MSDTEETNKIEIQVQELLKKGNERYRGLHGGPIHPLQDQSRRDDTKKSQHPFAIILSCADSRVPPEIIFDAGIGELFVLRVAGNIADISNIASIEFAIANLKCNYILVLGHEGCGAVKAAMAEGPAPSDNLSQLIGHILPAVKQCGCDSKITNKDYYNTATNNDDDLKKVTIQNVHHTISELKRCSTIIRKSNVEMCPAYYNLT